MVCFRSRRLAAGFLVIGVVLGACGGKKEQGKATGGQAGGGGGATAASNQDLTVIPPESDLVLGIDLAAAQKSAVFTANVLPQLLGSAQVQKILGTLKTKCDLDPLTAASRLTAGIRDLSGRNPDVVAVLHGVEKGKAMSCLDKVKDDLAAEKIELVKDGDVAVLKHERGDLAVTFTGDTTAVVVGGPRATKERVLEVAQGKSTLPTSKEFNEMYGRVQTQHTIWGLMNGKTPALADALDGLGVKSKAAFGSANMTDKLEVDGRIRVESEDQAKQLVETMKMFSGLIGKPEKLEIEAEGAEARFTVAFTQKHLESLLSRVKTLRR
jgi:hypothetical protein